MGRQSLQHILQVRERIAPEPLATGHETIQGRRRPAAPVTPNKQEVLSTDRLSTQTPFRAVVVPRARRSDTPSQTLADSTS